MGLSARRRAHVVGPGRTVLQHLRHRYYDIKIGRFISRDPLSIIPGRTDNSDMYACPSDNGNLSFRARGLCKSVPARERGLGNVSR